VRPTRRDALKAIATATCLGAAPARATGSTYEEAVRQTWRHSIGNQAGPKALQLELIRYATLAPNSHNTQPWKFRAQGETIDIVPDRASAHRWSIQTIIIFGSAWGAPPRTLYRPLLLSAGTPTSQSRQLACI
jgi:hypothetical protein